jgi:hypothetical protein
MDKWNRHSHHPRSASWNGWVVALLSGTVGMLIASLWWWRQSNASARAQQQHTDLRRLGQGPSRTHIQLFVTSGQAGAVVLDRRYC